MPSVTVSSPDLGTPTLSLKTIKSSVGATNFIKLSVAISQPDSKDVWVFITANDPDNWTITKNNVTSDVLVLRVRLKTAIREQFA
jgi:hypothetical protein